MMLGTTLSSFASSIEGYQRLRHRKGLAELQAADLTEVVEAKLTIIAEFGAHKLALLAAQASPRLVTS